MLSSVSASDGQAPERTPLLPVPMQNLRARYPWTRGWEAHPFWVLPLVFIVNLSRGATLAPQIQVYKTVACRALNPTEDVTVLDCSGPDVQARAARIQASVITTMNVLSAITTGFWGRVGDTHGRRLIIAIFFIGNIGRDLVYIWVMKPHTFFAQHAESLILVGPILEGLAGAVSSFEGVVHAYSSDCTPHGSRSKIFSTLQGFVFVGAALGPLFSSMVLPESSIMNPDNAFYLSIFIMAVTLVYILFIFPESRIPMSRLESSSPTDHSRIKASPIAILRRQVDRFFSAMLVPFTVFRPRLVPGHSHKRNYNLTLVGAGSFIYVASLSIINTKFLYSQHVYNWTTTQLGYFMSLLWFVKAVNLLIILPFLISYFKPTTPLHSAGPLPEHLSAEMRFDKRLTLYSLALDCFADTLITLVPTASQGSFVALSSLSSLASGGVPALHSLSAVCLHASGAGTELGALFGGTAVLSAVAHIISPYISAFTYGSTVAFFPKAVFFLCAVLLAIVIVLVNGITVRPDEIVVSPVALAEESDYEDLIQPLNDPFPAQTP